MPKEINYKEALATVINSDYIEIIFCKGCGKRWIHGEAGPGDYWMFDIAYDFAKEWSISKNSEGFNKIHMINCKCGFPLLVDVHTEEPICAAWTCDKFAQED